MTDSLTNGTDKMTGPALGAGGGTAAHGSSPAQLARTAAEAVRALNHATMDPDGGYGYAGDVYDVLGDLCDVADYLSQAVTQAARWLTQADAAGRLSDVDDRSARGTLLTAAEAASMLASAARYAAVAGSDLATAQCAVGRLATDDSAPFPYLPADTAGAR
ncbi:hypothetical protein [Kineosporia sp. A_224]|uniref:hypothetical protein n=1 Tax=Kineosporia sp. A_224 TaxID=1962180 RepID=UPI000B4BF270|nr:hypothetical protein [Kineosporia sp. A_224]